MLDPKIILEYTTDLRVLYVEDEEIVAKQTMLLLGEYFRELDHAYDGQEGLDMYKAARTDGDEGYDLVITDINMPNMNGIELSMAIIKINQEQKIVVISAHNDAQHLYQLINVGVDRFITKPISIEHMMKTFYSIGKSISDHKYVQHHYEHIEELNGQLTKKNRELEKSLRMYDNMVMKEKLNQQKTTTKESLKVKVEEEKNQDDLNDLVENGLPELFDLYDEMDALIFKMILAKEADKIQQFANNLYKYSSVLSGHYTFYELSVSFKKLSDFIKNESLPDDKEKVHNILSILESFLFTLNRWQDSWSHTKGPSANFFDDSLKSDIDTIMNIWKEEEEYEEIEFF